MEAQQLNKQEQKLGVLDKIDRVITGIVYGLASIPIIIFTLIWIVVSLVIGYGVFKVIFFS
jgi:hypothetical protein